MTLIDDKDFLKDSSGKLHERLALALRGASLGVWDWNVATGDVVFDQRWAEMIGYTLDEIEPNVKSWEKLVHPDDMKQVMSVLTDHLEGRISFYQTEHRMKHKQGHYIWVLDSGRVFDRDKDGRPLRASGVHLDITARKQAEEDRERFVTQLRRSNDELDRYAHVVAHDLLQPLSAVVGCLEVAEKGGIIAAQAMADAKDTVLGMIATVEYLLEYAQATRAAGTTTSVDSAAVLNKVISLAPYMYPEADADIRIEGTLPFVMCDEIQLERVFANLVGNAIKYAGDKPPVIRVSAQRDGAFHLFSVRDNGVGMNAGEAAGIFDMFQRGERSRKGYGIGLSICRKIIEDCGGKIWTESSPGKGSTFFFSLPESKQEHTI